MWGADKPVLRDGRARAQGALLAGTALVAPAALAVFLMSPQALAACSTTAPNDGDTVNCVGQETNPIGDILLPPASQVTVNVAPGASIAVGDGGVAIVLDQQNRIVNHGTISTGDGTGVFPSVGIALFGDDNTVVNNGSIIGGNAVTSWTTGIQIFGLNGQVTNNGLVQVGNGVSAAIPTFGISVFDESRVTNNGRIVGGDFSYGVFACCDNVIVNTATGSITLGDYGFGIAASDGNTIVNEGAITVGNVLAPGVGNAAVGIDVQDNNTVVNTGRITAGNGLPGFYAYGIRMANGNTVTNSGTITVGNLAQGIGVDDVFGGANTITNQGTIRAGNQSIGIWSQFDGMNIDNRGIIAVGDGIASVGIFFRSGTVTNTGTITAGSDAIGIAAIGDDARISNAGTIATGASGTGINIWTGALDAVVQNSGTISVGPGGTGVKFDGAGALTNTGFIGSTGSGYSVFSCDCVDATVNNLGTLDGLIEMRGATAFQNRGLIGITDPEAVTPIGPFSFNISHFGGAGTATFEQFSSGTLSMRIRPGAPAPVDGLLGDTITLAGTLHAAIQPGLYDNTTTSNAAVSLTGNGAANITTTFDRFVSSSPFFTVTPIYNGGAGLPADYSFLTLQLYRLGFGSVPGMTPNQQAVGNALETVYASGVPTGNAATFYANLFATTSVGILDRLSGQGLAAAQSAAFGAGAQFNTGMLTQGLNGGGASVFVAPAAYAPVSAPRGHEAFATLKAQPAAGQPGGWRLWTLGFGAARKLDGESNPGSAGQSLRTGGGAFGVEHFVAPGLVAGVALGGSTTSISVSDLSTSGRVTGGHLGAYAVKHWGAFYAAGSVSYARFENETTRQIAGIGPAETATARFASDQIGGRLELGWKQTYGRHAVTPFVAIEPAATWQHGFTETTPGGILGLRVAGRTTTSLPAFVGVQFESSGTLSSGAVLSPFARVSWVHEFRPDREISASFVSIPQASFTVAGARAARDAMRFDGGAKLALREGVALFANLTGEWSDRSRSYGATGGIRATW